MPFDGTSHDPTLVHALGPDLFGPDELASLPPTAIVVLADLSGRATVQELLAFNANNDAVPAEFFFSVEQDRQDIVEIDDGVQARGLFALRLITDPDGPSRFEVLGILQEGESASPLDGQTLADDPMAELVALVEADDWPDVVAFLRTQLERHRGMLYRLQLVAGAHRDGIQNAVDTVQTKRIDLQEEPKETTIAGAAMALVVETALVAIPTAIAGRLLLRLATGLFALTGVLRVAAKAAPAFLKRREHRKQLAALQKTLAAQKVSRLGLAPSKKKLKNLKVQAKTAKRRAEAQQEKIERAKRAHKEVMLEARQKAKAFTSKLEANTVATSGGGYLLEKAADAVGEAVKAPPTAPAAPSAKLLDSGFTHIPVDVALKMQVQDFFADWLATVEEGRQALEGLILSAELFQTLPDTDAASEVLNRVLVPETEFNETMDELELDVSDVGQLRTDLETEYELLVWVLKYYDIFLQGPMIKPLGDGETPVTEYYEALPPDVDRRLMRYLALRFFPSAVRKGKNTEERDPEVVMVYKVLHGLAIRIRDMIGDGSSAVDAGDGSLSIDEEDRVVFDILKEIRILRQEI